MSMHTRQVGITQLNRYEFSEMSGVKIMKTFENKADYAPEVYSIMPNSRMATIQVGTVYARGTIVDRSGTMATIKVDGQILSGREVPLQTKK